MKISMKLALAVLASSIVTSAFAADMAPVRKAPVYKAPVAADSWSPWMIRLRALGVVPDASGRVDQIAGSNIGIGSSVVPELDISYFFTQNIAAELILGVTPHNIKGAGTLTGVDVGRAWLLPPTLTLQYHFTGLGGIKPYLGAGVNYTVFFNQTAAGGTITQLNVKNAPGLALQAGVDIMIDRNWGVNVDVKKIFLRPDVSLNNGALTGKATIDPWLIATGLTYRF